jgi:hypothetical protein
LRSTLYPKHIIQQQINDKRGVCLITHIVPANGQIALLTGAPVVTINVQILQQAESIQVAEAVDLNRLYCQVPEPVFKWKKLVQTFYITATISPELRVDITALSVGSFVGAPAPALAITSSSL